MKRRNVDSTKHRKQFPMRKCKFTEGMYGSSFIYLKFLLLWALIITADYLLEFRFEFLWPFWLLVRSLHDSVKYQGIIFAVFFGSIAFFSDLVCYMFLPVHWLFFIASTYVWVQYVWHTDRGVCLSTVLLWLFFVYIEAYLRLSNFKTIDLCRPLAAHCIGYPIVTLGFGFKSYISFKCRLKKQKKIQKLNEFYHSLVKKALPLEFQLTEAEYDQEISIKEQNADVASKISKFSKTSIISTALSYYLHSNQPNSSSSSSVAADDLPYIQQKNNVNTKKNSEKNFSQKSSNSECVEFSKVNFSNTKQYSNCSIKQSKQLNNTNNVESNEQVDELNLPSFSIQSLALTQNNFQNQNGNVNLNGINVNNNGSLVLLSNGSSKSNSNHNRSSSNTYIPNNSHTNININMTINTTAIATATANANATPNNNRQNSPGDSNSTSNTSSNSKKNKNKENKNLSIPNAKQSNVKLSEVTRNDLNYKQELINSLEEELKKLKLEIEQQKKVEQYLRDQINYITKCDRSEKLKQENEALQSKINDLRGQKEKDREQFEKQLQEERKKRTDLEIQLAKEKKLRETSSQATKKSCTQGTSNGPSVSESNQKKLNQLENENKELKNQCSIKQDTISHLESEIKNLSTMLQSNENVENLKEKLKNMEEKTAILQESLREETRFKMNLFSALGEAKRQIEFFNRELDAKDTELNMVKAILYKQSLSNNSFSNGLLNETAQSDLISQLLANQLSAFQNHNFNSNQIDGNQNCEGSRKLSCSSPGMTDMNQANFSPSSCNENSLQTFDSDTLALNNVFPKI